MLTLLALAKKLAPVLTTGGIVSSDSVWTNAGDIGYANCLHGLIDNKYYPNAYWTMADRGKCCATTM